MAYKLQLPPSSLIHPVIHVSQLKKALPPNTTISSDADLHLLSQFQDLTADRVLECRLQLVGQHVVPMELIQRAGCPQHWLPRSANPYLDRRRPRLHVADFVVACLLLHSAQRGDALHLKRGRVL